MFSLFDKKPVLDEAAVQWLFDTFAWSLSHFDARLFYDETILVTPSNEHFPGTVDSVDGMATLIFEKVQEYAGLSHWPCRLVDQASCGVTESPRVVIEGALRESGGVAPADVAEENRLQISYNPQQINNPEALIATFAHTLAHYLAAVTAEPPPGGDEYWPQATEVLAIYMGFGLMFANSAYNYRGGCGSCFNPQAERSATLTQEEALYALAFFSVLKAIEQKDVERHIKKPLRAYFRRCVKDVLSRDEALQRLRTLDA